MPLNENGRKCNCSGVACLETYIGNDRILKDARIIFKRRVCLEDLSRLAHKGDARAKRIWVTAGQRLGVALSGVVNLLNPDSVVIGGGVANAGKVLFDAVRGTIKKRAMSVQSKRVKIVKARLGSDAGMIGAALLVNEGV
jgi:predicted NBD/HSP70 family sugar kinase